MTDGWAIDIARTDIADARIVPDAAAPLADGQVRVAITGFALTANNVTYALFGGPNGFLGGDAGYWDFFADRDAPGRLPVWGFAAVSESRVEGIAAGDTFYGYWPMASGAVLTPASLTGTGFIDGTPRRRALPLTYNNYQRLDALGDYRAEHHDLWPVFRPLYMTGWLIADQLADEGDFGADRILVASASSKTAIGLAHALRLREGPRPRVTGLTSAANVAAVETTGLYDEVVTYDAIDALPAGPAAYVDMAGNGAVTARVHHHFGDQLTASIIVGKSHWDADGGEAALPGPARLPFFAPGRVDKRVADWGGAGLASRMAAGWLSFMDLAPSLLRIDHRQGSEGALDAYRQLIAGQVDPAVGIIVTP